MDLDPRIGETRLRTAATRRASARDDVHGHLVLADRADDCPGLLVWFTDDAGELHFVGGWEDIADTRYLSRWRPTRIVEVSLRAGRSVTFAGPRKPITAIIDGYERFVPVRH